MSRPFSKFVRRSSERAFNSRPYICFGKGGARAWISGKPGSQFYCMKMKKGAPDHCSEPKMSRPFSTFVRRSSERAFNSRPYICFRKGGAPAWPSGKPESQFYRMKSEERGSRSLLGAKNEPVLSPNLLAGVVNALSIRDHIYVFARAERLHGPVGSLKVNFTV